MRKILVAILFLIVLPPASAQQNGAAAAPHEHAGVEASVGQDNSMAGMHTALGGWSIPKGWSQGASGGRPRRWKQPAAGYEKLGDDAALGPGAQNHDRYESEQQSVDSMPHFYRRNYAFSRLELVDKDELFPQAPVHPAYRIGAYTFGGVLDLIQNLAWQLGLGADVTMRSKPASPDLACRKHPVSSQISLRMRPGRSEQHHGH